MKKEYKFTFAFVILMTATLLIINLIISNTIVTPEFSDRDKVFMTGSIDDVKEFLDSSERGVHLTNFYSLIRRGRNDILEMVIRDYDYRADLNAVEIDLATPLYFSAQEFKPKSVRVLIKYGADVNYQDPYGMTPLIAASYTTFEYENPASLEITKMLVEAGANIDAVANYGKTAIEGALFSDDIKRVKYLVQNGGDKKHTNNTGANYMFYCNSTECYEYFLSLGFNINSINTNGKSIFQGAHYGEIPMELTIQLLSWGADICHKDNAGDTVLNYVERQNTGPHDKKEKPEYYQKRLTENRGSEIYKFLYQKYQEECLAS